MTSSTFQGGRGHTHTLDPPLGSILGLQAKKGGGPTLGPMLESLHRGPKGGSRPPAPLDPPMHGDHGESIKIFTATLGLHLTLPCADFVYYTMGRGGGGKLTTWPHPPQQPLLQLQCWVINPNNTARDNMAAGPSFRGPTSNV